MNHYRHNISSLSYNTTFSVAKDNKAKKEKKGKKKKKKAAAVADAGYEEF